MFNINKGFNYKYTEPSYNENNQYYILRGYTLDEVGIKFFSKKNIDHVQSMIKKIVNVKTNNRVILTENQNEMDLLLNMRAIYLLHNRALPYSVNKQVDMLNEKLLEFIIPDMLTNILQHIDYIRDIQSPLKPIDRPLNDSLKGSKTPKSYTNVIFNLLDGEKEIHKPLDFISYDEYKNLRKN
jgi:hypothetical protein